MEEKRNFFQSLEPKSALILGGVGGFLVLCTIGFFVLLGIMLSKNISTTPSDEVSNTGTQVQNTNQQAPVQQADIPKSDKPKVELFVMSYCPFGLQMEKAYLPVMNLLKNKADMTVKFVNYAMHGLKEIEENTRQYCIGKEQSDKLVSYLSCFTAKDDYQSCLTSVKINQTKLNTCVTATNKQFGTMDKYNDQTTWLSGRYPLYPIHDTLNKQYGVQGSPTLVINGVEASAGRTPEAVKQAVCAAFNNAPAECNQVLSNTTFEPGFGTAAASGDTANAECG